MDIDACRIGLAVRRRSGGGLVQRRHDMGPRRIGRIVGPVVSGAGTAKVPVQWLPVGPRSEPELVSVQRLEKADVEDTEALPLP